MCVECHKNVGTWEPCIVAMKIKRIENNVCTALWLSNVCIPNKLKNKKFLHSYGVKAMKILG